MNRRLTRVNQVNEAQDRVTCQKGNKIARQLTLNVHNNYHNNVHINAINEVMEMATCVPIKDLRDTAAFDAMVEASPTPITVTKNGYDRFVCVKSADFNRWEQADARAALLERIMIAERERSEGLSVDAFEATAALRDKYEI